MATAYSRLHLLPPLASPATERYGDAIALALGERRAAFVRALDALRAAPEPLCAAVALLVSTLGDGGKVLAAGNGGSAAEAQHFVAELVGRFKRERRPYPALALTADPAVLTAVANDYGFSEVFARQVRAWGRPGDALVLFSTSGRSPNVLEAAWAARECGVRVVAVTGGGPNPLAAASDVALRAPVDDTPLIQELHAVVVHLLCDLVEAELAGDHP
jgi:D-sedoheptulose 7-phosphate isomerase